MTRALSTATLTLLLSIGAGCNGKPAPDGVDASEAAPASPTAPSAELAPPAEPSAPAETAPAAAAPADPAPPASAPTDPAPAATAPTETAAPASARGFIDAARAIPAGPFFFGVFADPERLLSTQARLTSADDRARMKELLGLDPLVAASWRELGVDLRAPAAVAVFGGEGPVVIAAFAATGGDAELIRLRALFEREAPTHPIDVGEAAGFVQGDGDSVVARVGATLYLISGRLGDDGPGDAGARALLERLVALTPEQSLAKSAAFTGVMGDLAPGDAAFWVEPSALSRARMNIGLSPELTEIRAAALSLRVGEGTVHAQVRIEPSSLSRFKRIFQVGRDAGALLGVPGPVVLAAQVKIDPAVGGRLLASQLMPDSAHFKEATGVDLDKDVIGALSGELGVLLGRLPVKSERSFPLFVEVGLRDAPGFKATLDALIRSAGVRSSPEDVGGSTLYPFSTDGAPGDNAAIGLDDHRVWLSTDVAGLRQILAKKGPVLGDDPEAAAAARVLSAADTGVAYARLGALLRQARVLMSRSDARALEPVTSIFDGRSEATMALREDGGSLVIDAAVGFDEAALEALARQALAEAFSEPRANKASADLCRAAYANMTKVQIEASLEMMRDLPEDAVADAKKSAEDAMKAGEAAFVRSCREMPSPAVACLAQTKVSSDFAACAQQR